MSIHGIYRDGELYRQMWLNGKLIWKCSDSLFPYTEDCVLTYVNNANVRQSIVFKVIDETKPYSINGRGTRVLTLNFKGEKEKVKLVNLMPNSKYDLFPISIEQLKLPTVTDLSGLFLCFCRVEDYEYSWQPQYFKFSENITSMAEMFAGCVYLKQEMWEQFVPYFPNTSNVTDMSYMFQGCSSLTSLDLSSWDVSQCTNMSGMFKGCSSLTSLDLSSFNTSNVTDMSRMFQECKLLDSLDLSSWDVSKVENFSFMFNNTCIKSINLSNWDMSKFDSKMPYRKTRVDMFSNNVCLETVNVSNWKLPTDSLTHFFYGCPARKIVGLETWNTSTITDMSFMFMQCSNLTEFDVSHFNTSNVTTMDRMFYGCGNTVNYDGMRELDLSSWNVSKVKSMYYMFNDCSNLRTINTTGWNVSNVESMGGMFRNCKNLQTFDMSNWNIQQILSSDSMFENCEALRSVNTSGLTSTTWVRFVDMFKNCSSLASIDFSGIKSQTWTVGGMFDGCTSIKHIDISGFDTTYQESQMILGVGYMFRGVTNCNIYLSNAWSYDTDANCYGGVNNIITILDTYETSISMGENRVHYAQYSPNSGMTSIFIPFMRELTEERLLGVDVGLFDENGILLARGNFTYSLPITGCDIDLADTGIETNTTLRNVYLAGIYFEPIYQVYKEGIPCSNKFDLKLKEY